MEKVIETLTGVSWSWLYQDFCGLKLWEHWQMSSARKMERGVFFVKFCPVYLSVIHLIGWFVFQYSLTSPGRYFESGVPTCRARLITIKKKSDHFQGITAFVNARSHRYEIFKLVRELLEESNIRTELIIMLNDFYRRLVSQAWGKLACQNGKPSIFRRTCLYPVLG